MAGPRPGHHASDQRRMIADQRADQITTKAVAARPILKTIHPPVERGEMRRRYVALEASGDRGGYRRFVHVARAKKPITDPQRYSQRTTSVRRGGLEPCRRVPGQAMEELAMHAIGLDAVD